MSEEGRIALSLAVAFTFAGLLTIITAAHWPAAIPGVAIAGAVACVAGLSTIAGFGAFFLLPRSQ